MAVGVKADKVDVVVVGAGLVGSIGALLLAQAGYQVHLIERSGPPAEPSTEPSTEMGQRSSNEPPDIAGLPLRHVALSPASQTCLNKINAWPIPNLGVFSSMQVWEERGTARLSLGAAQVGRDELGWVAQHAWLHWHLHQQFVGLDRIAVHYHSEIDTLEQTQDGELQLGFSTAGADPSTFCSNLLATLVIGADGANSAVAKHCRVPISRHDTGHHALVAMVRFAQPHQGVARQRFLLDGPLALLPSAWPDLVSIVWSQNADNAERRAQQPAADFCAELSLASDEALGPALEVGPRAGFPVAQQLADRFLAAPGVLLLGDAAHVIHPLAGQGVNAGIEDMTELLELLGRRGAKGGNFRLPAGLARFAARRRARAQTLAMVMGGLQGIYAQTNPAFNLLRNSGVRLLQSSAIGQRLLIEQALGLKP
jgi:2-octaprenylphenol hydroxylase